MWVWRKLLRCVLLDGTDFRQPRTDEVADSHSDGLEESDIIFILAKRSGSVTHFGKVGYHVIFLEDSL